MGPSPTGLTWPPAPTGPPDRPHRRNPLGIVLILLSILTVVALGVLAWAAFVIRPATTTYVNDDYQPPPVVAQPDPAPVPTSIAQAKQWTTDNPVYRSSVSAPVRCAVPRLIPAQADPAQLQQHLDALTLCLMRAWDGPLRSSGFRLIHPVVNIYTGSVTTPCGTKSHNAGFCVANQQFYYGSTIATTDVPGIDRNPWAHDVIMAHEFGHFLQARTGIYQATYAIEDQMISREELLAINRRLENQADCFSGLFLRSVSRSIGLTQDQLDWVIDVYVKVGSDTLSGEPNISSDHGRAASRRFWGVTGLSTGAVGSCNTFTASAELNR